MSAETPLYEAIKAEMSYDPTAFRLASHAEFMAARTGKKPKPRGKKKR